jgi:hypothetical protein
MSTTVDAIPPMIAVAATPMLLRWMASTVARMPGQI